MKYILALAKKNRAELATLDTGIPGGISVAVNPKSAFEP